MRGEATSYITNKGGGSLMSEGRDEEMTATLKGKITDLKKLDASNRKKLIRELAVRAIKRNEEAYWRLSKN